MFYSDQKLASSLNLEMHFSNEHSVSLTVN